MYWGFWLAQLVQQVILDLGVVSLSPKLGIKIYLKSLKFKEKSKCTDTRFCKTKVIQLNFSGGTWAKSVEHATLDLRVLSLSPTLGVEVTEKAAPGCLSQKSL